jgi:hypothetical protein
VYVEPQRGEIFIETQGLNQNVVVFFILLHISYLRAQRARRERDSSGTTCIYGAHKCQRHAVAAKYIQVMERIARRERASKCGA